MYLSCHFWAMYRTLRRCCDLTHKWIISNPDAAPQSSASALQDFVTWLAK